MSEQASLGAGILQTAFRISVTVGIAISSVFYHTALQNQQVQTTPAMNSGWGVPTPQVDASLPFQRAYLCSIVFASIGIALCLVICMMRKTNGVRNAKDRKPTIVELEDLSKSALPDEESFATGTGPPSTHGTTTAHQLKIPKPRMVHVIGDTTRQTGFTQNWRDIIRQDSVTPTTRSSPTDDTRDSRSSTLVNQDHHTLNF